MSKSRAIDKNNMEYKIVSETKAGDKVLLDDGFTCMDHFVHTIIRKDENGLFFYCKEGKHYLDGQYEDYKGEVEPFYIGIYKCY